MSKRLVRIYTRAYRGSVAFALAKPNTAVAILIGLGVAVAIGLWFLVVPIFAPAAIAPFMHTTALLP
jgi:hypothetical protein